MSGIKPQLDTKKGKIRELWKYSTKHHLKYYLNHWSGNTSWFLMTIPYKISYSLYKYFRKFFSDLMKN